MRRHTARWLYGAFVMLALSAPAVAAPKAVPDFIMQPAPAASASPWQVAGRVVFQGTGAKRLPAAGVAVFLTAANGQVVDRSQTDAQGQYLLSAPGPGKYEIRIDQSATARRHGLLVAPFKQVITL